MSCDVGKATEGLENEQSSHSPTFPSLHLRHSSFSNPSVALPTSQLILQPFRRFTYVTAHSPTLSLLHPRHSSFSNISFASPTSPTLHLRHLASRPCNFVCFLLCKIASNQGRNGTFLYKKSYCKVYWAMLWILDAFYNLFSLRKYYGPGDE